MGILLESGSLSLNQADRAVVLFLPAGNNLTDRRKVKPKVQRV